MSVNLSCLPSYINCLCIGGVLCSSEMGNMMHPGAWLWEHSEKGVGNNLSEYLPLIGFFGYEVAISIILKFAHKYTCL